MVEVVQRRIVLQPDIDDADRWVRQVFVGRFAAFNCNTMQMSQQTTCQKIVFVGSARMSHYQLDCHEVALIQNDFLHSERHHIHPLGYVIVDWKSANADRTARRSFEI